jgi:hypothetical protein
LPPDFADFMLALLFYREDGGDMMFRKATLLPPNPTALYRRQ